MLLHEFLSPMTNIAYILHIEGVFADRLFGLGEGMPGWLKIVIEG